MRLDRWSEVIPPCQHGDRHDQPPTAFVVEISQFDSVVLGLTTCCGLATRQACLEFKHEHEPTGQDYAVNTAVAPRNFVFEQQPPVGCGWNRGGQFQ
ncbi:MAG: hypothetical protein NT154_04080 [Verrucomicrobia bacterium]|nr:hypothetical protein [Verrucomicrobiota bacterium]